MLEAFYSYRFRGRGSNICHASDLIAYRETLGDSAGVGTAMGLRRCLLQLICKLLYRYVAEGDEGKILCTVYFETDSLRMYTWGHMPQNFL